jgi:hypothetical protein
MIPKPLLDDIAAVKCLPFIGAGFSLNAKLPASASMPDWPALTAILAELAEVRSKTGGPQVASAYEKKFGRVQLIETIRHSLNSDDMRVRGTSLNTQITQSGGVSGRSLIN